MGLLLLRFTLSAFLLNLLVRRASPGVDTILAALAAPLVTIGLWTPVGGVLAAVSLLWNGLASDGTWPAVLAAPVGIALSLVGPGAVSLDAHRFGRKRVIFDDRRN